MSHNLDGINIELHDPVGPAPRRQQTMAEKSKASAEEEWRRSKKNIGKMMKLGADDFTVKKVVSDLIAGRPAP